MTPGAEAGPVNLELRPTAQTVNMGETVNIELQAVSADGNNQSVGFLGVVVHWDPTALLLLGHNDNGPFAWNTSGFPSDSGGLNADLTDGDAYFQAAASAGGPYATATASGLLVTTLQFTTVQPVTVTTPVSLAVCDGASCTVVLNKLPGESGVTEITGVLGPAVDVTIACQFDADCDDGNPCTDDACVSNACTNVPDDTNDPNDGLFCNGLEIGCSNGDIIVDPGSVPDCDDGLPCTNDSCDEINDTCVNEIAPSFCVIDGTCYADGALDPNNDCAACDTAMSVTAWTLRPAGAPCGDAQDTECNSADTCDGAGTCQANLAAAGTPCGSADDTVCTDPDTCDGAGACLPNNAPDATPCDDGLFCTVTDACSSGVCTGAGDACPDFVCDDVNDLCKRVDPEWRDVLPNPVAVGDVVEVGFYVASVNGLDQTFGSLSLVMQWDSGRLKLLGNVDNGPYDWLSSSFPDDSGLDGLNNTFEDGDAFYLALGRLAPSPLPIATTSGLLVTTFQFEARAPGSASLSIIPQIGSTETRVLDVDPPSLDITGPPGPPASIQIVECLDDPDCDDGEFCNGSESCVNNVCVAGTPPDCDDGLFCTGTETCVFGAGCVSSGDPCPLPGSCDDPSDTCGGCLTPVVEAEGARYLAITPQAGADPVALYVVGDPDDPEASCVRGYVHPQAGLIDSPVYRTPAEWGTVHLTGCVIRPDTRYFVYADCGRQTPGLLSAPVGVTTRRWGDVDGNGTVNITDLTIVNDATNGIFGGFTIPNVDLAPCSPDGVIDNLDTSAVQSALANDPFPCPDVCLGGERTDACPVIPAATVWGLVVLTLLITTGGCLALRRVRFSG